MKLAICAAVAAALLTGCSATVSVSTGGSSQAPTPRALAAKISGCHGYFRTEAADYTQAEGQCTLGDGGMADISVFTSNDARDNALNVAKAFGGGYYVIGDRWMVGTVTEDDAATVQHSIGGAIK